MNELESRTIRKITWRLLPFLMACYFIAFLDRTNVAFAHVAMVADLKMSEAAFGLGAGIFFIGYFLVEVPSNMLLERFGARRWIARIMISWGIVSAAFAFVPQIADATGMSNERVFLVLRFLLGLAEAGFYPGIVFYLTMWFPKVYRARVVGLFMLGIPLSGFIGAPLSGFLLTIESHGLSGWQWLFIGEALPSVVLGLATLVVLPDFPSGVRWLKDDERNWIIESLLAEMTETEQTAGHAGLLKTMLNPLILQLSFVYFLYQAAGYAGSMFMPGVFAKLGYDHTTTGWLLSIPPLVGILGMFIVCGSSDRRRERKLHLAFCIALVAIGLAGAGVAAHQTVGFLISMSIFYVGVSTAVPIFWTIPPSILRPGVLAAGIAAINSLGALGGFVGPSVFGFLTDAMGSDRYGLVISGGVAISAALLVLMLKIRQYVAAASASSRIATVAG